MAFLGCFIGPFIRSFESLGHFMCLALERKNTCKIHFGNKTFKFTFQYLYGTTWSNRTVT